MLNNFIFTIIICLISTIANGGELVKSGVNGSINCLHVILLFVNIL